MCVVFCQYDDQSVYYYVLVLKFLLHLPVPAAVGLSFLQFTNMNSMRNLFITGVSLFLGLSIPEYFFSYTQSARHGPAHTDAGWVCYY